MEVSEPPQDGKALNGSMILVQCRPESNFCPLGCFSLGVAGGRVPRTFIQEDLKGEEGEIMKMPR